MIERFLRTLSLVQQLAGNNFSGIGIIVCASDANLPLFPIRPRSVLPVNGDLIDDLVTISLTESEFHDGFHIVSTKWELMKVSQYFSPPIVTSTKIDRTKRFGGRYLAALFGSTLPDVEISGIASNGFGIAIFQHGREVCYEQPQ